MITVSVSQAEGLDAAGITSRVVASGRRRLKGRRPSAGILFAAAGFDHQIILDRVRDAFPDMPLIGCTTAGNFSSDGGYSDDAVSLMLFSSDTVEIHAGLGRNLSRGYGPAAREALAMASRNRTRKARVCLALPDLVRHAGGDVIDALHRELAGDCAIFGGSPAALDFTGQSIRQFFGGEVLEDALPLLLFSGPVDYGYFVANSWHSLGPRVTVSAAEGRRVTRIGRQRALDFYFHYLGPHTEPATEFPLAVYAPDGVHFSLRAPMYYHPEEGAITFAETIPAGAVVQLSEAYRDHLISDIERSTRVLGPKLKGLDPFAALAFSCSLRKQALGTRTPEEVQALARANRPGIPVMGFYGFGEIAPPETSLESICHNATLVVLVLGTPKGGAAVEGRRTALRETPSPEGTPSAQEDRKEDEKAFLRTKLARSEAYRRRLEDIKELNAGLHRQIIQEVEAARREIARREEESATALRLAGEVQKNLLPRGHLTIGDLQVAGRNRPCKAIGGDYFDYLKPDPSCYDCLSVAVGDISGHGVDAALLMTSARGFLRTRVAQADGAARIVTDMNNYLVEDVLDSGRFMTLFFLSIDPRRGELRWVRAGHDPAMVYRPSKDRFETLRGDGMALGVEPGIVYAESALDALEPGQLIAIATDGIFEARDRQGTMFGRPRLQEILHRCRQESAPTILDRVFEALARHTGGVAPEDDQTLVVVKNG